MVLRYFINVLLIFLTNLPIQCKPSQQCKCCHSCRCCNQNSISSSSEEEYRFGDNYRCCNQNISSPSEEEYRFGDNYIYSILSKEVCGNMELTQEDVNKIARNYIRIINEADNTVKTLNDVATDILTSKIIIEYLGINEAINEIDNINDVSGKIIKIKEIVNNEFINKKYTYEDSTLKLPRCLVEHENNNCAIESYSTAMLGDPYIVKFFYLLYYLFEKGLLSKENYPVTFEFCKFFNEAVSHPNFTDTIKCISITKAYFDHYPNSDYVQMQNKIGRHPTYSSFQARDFVSEINKKIIDELNTSQGLKQHMPLLEEDIFSKTNTHSGESGRDSKCNLCYYYPDITTLDKLNYSGYKCNDNFIHFTAITFCAEGFHFYTFRKINNIWISYDSYKVKTPTPVSDKFISRLILNSILWIPNFNGHYSKYGTFISEHNAFN